MKNKILQITLTTLFIIALVLFVLTASIGLPIYCRFFYYIQIKTLDMEANSGFTYEQIKTAYDQVLNYLTLPNQTFGTGELAHSAEGSAHFADCKVLFDLNFWVLLSSSLVLITYGMLIKRKVITLSRPFGHSACMIAAIVALALPLVIGGLAALDFDAAFSVFHQIFFPGKDNWIFNPYTDEIIMVMPQQFFMNCAILIGCGLLTFAAALFIYDGLTYKKLQK